MTRRSRRQGIHARLANSHPDLVAGLVKCLKCGAELEVNAAECLASGWPLCCGHTMALQPARPPSDNPLGGNS